MNVEFSERNNWGQWHRAGAEGVGMDRTVASGTGFIGQYRPAVAHMFESMETCPDDLLLFMHHVPYTHALHSGKTVIQYIYDSHYDGAEAVRQYVSAWESLEGRIDKRRYTKVLAELKYQRGQAQVWRDAVTTWFLRTSGIPDAHNRVGVNPGWMEAESMQLEGYTVTSITPWETASGGKAIECRKSSCAASFRYDGQSGWHTIHIQYFDPNNGVACFRVYVTGQLIDQWAADDHLPTQNLDGASSTARTIPVIALRAGDEIRIEGVPGGGDPAAIDYVEVDASPGILRPLRDAGRWPER